jgi:hypothetical protein
LIRYFRACGSCQDFLNSALLLTRKLLNQGFLLVKLKLSFTVATMTWLTVNGQKKNCKRPNNDP